MSQRFCILSNRGSNNPFSSCVPSLSLSCKAPKKAPPSPSTKPRRSIPKPVLDTSHYPHRVGYPAPLPSLFSEQVELTDAEAAAGCLGGLSVASIRRAARDILVAEGVEFQSITILYRVCQAAPTSARSYTGTRSDADPVVKVPTLVINSEIFRTVLGASTSIAAAATAAASCKMHQRQLQSQRLKRATGARFSTGTETRWTRWLHVLERINTFILRNGNNGGVAVEIADFSQYFALLPMSFAVEFSHPLHPYLDLLREQVLAIISAESSSSAASTSSSLSYHSGGLHGHGHGDNINNISNKWIRRHLESLASTNIKDKETTTSTSTSTAVNEVVIMRRGEHLEKTQLNPVTIVVLCDDDPQAAAARYGGALLAFCRDRGLWSVDRHIYVEFARGGAMAPEPQVEGADDDDSDGDDDAIVEKEKEKGTGAKDLAMSIRRIKGLFSEISRETSRMMLAGRRAS